MSLHMAIWSPPPWARPFTAATTGLADWRRPSNGVTSMPIVEAKSIQLSSPPWPRSPPGGEHVSGTGDQEAGQVIVGIHSRDGLADPEVHRGSHRVACNRAVER